MGLLNRFRRARDASKKAKEQGEPDLDFEELDDELLDAGDALETEAERERERRRQRQR